MAKLIYVTNVSVDDYIEDEHGSFDWISTGDELLAFITDLVRPVGTFLYGRRLYDTMALGRPTPPWPRGRNSWPSHPRRRRQARAAQPYSLRFRAAGRSPTQRRCRVPPLPHRDLRVQGHASRP